VQQRSTEQVVLACKECGEKLVLFGPAEDWRSRGAVLLCGSAHKVTLDDCDAEEEALPDAS
jgi:hypothetical protein